MKPLSIYESPRQPISNIFASEGSRPSKQEEAGRYTNLRYVGSWMGTSRNSAGRYPWADPALRVIRREVFQSI